MARPTKQGIDYFPLDVQFDDKMELLIVELGSDALSVMITVWQLIYQNEGYYIANGPDLYLLIRRRILVDVSVAQTVISRAIDRDIFDKVIHSKHKIITSKAIQKRFFVAASRKMVVNVYKNYLLVDVNVYKNISVSGIDVYKNATNVNVEVEVKEEVNKKGKFNPINIKPDWISTQDWEDIISHRRKVKATESERAYSGLINKLSKIEGSGFTVSECVDEMCQRGWKGFDIEWMPRADSGKYPISGREKRIDDFDKLLTLVGESDNVETDNCPKRINQT